MKKILAILFIVALLSGKGFSQPSQGSISVGGTFNFAIDNNKTKAGGTTVDGPKTINFTLIPSLEYFVMQNISAGMGLGYTYSKTNDYPGDPDQESKTSLFSIVPALRYYKGMGEKVSIFVQGSLGLGFGKNESTTGIGTTTLDVFSFDIGLRPGIHYLVSSKIALEATFGYIGFNSYTLKSGNNKSTDNSIQLSVDPTSVGFGVRFFLQ